MFPSAKWLGWHIQTLMVVDGASSVSIVLPNRVAPLRIGTTDQPLL